MANVLHTQVFAGPESRQQEKTRQRIVQEARVGKRPAQAPLSSTDYDQLLRGNIHLPDPWAPTNQPRTTLQPPISGYTGHIARMHAPLADD